MNESDKRMAFFGASLDPHLPIIDLHRAEDLVTALELLDRGLDQVIRSRVRACRIIYGVGEGVLARAVHKNLANNKQILGWQEEESGGSSVVLL